MDTVKSFTTELSSLYELEPPISRAKMRSLTRGAIRAAKCYEHVVQSVETFILKCKPEYKIPGLYVIDSIVRQSRHQFGIDKDVFAPRFAKNIQQTFFNLYQCPPEDMGKIIRVLNLWQNNQIFAADVIRPLFNLSDPNKPLYNELVVPNQRNEHNSLQKAPSNMLTVPPGMAKVPKGAPPTNLQQPLMTDQLLVIGSQFQRSALIPMSLSNENSPGNSDNNMKNRAESLMGFGQKCNMITQPPCMSEETIMQEDNMNIKMEDTHQEPCSNENVTSRDDRGDQRDTESENDRNKDRRRSRSRDRDGNSAERPNNEDECASHSVKIDVDILEQFIDENGIRDRRILMVNNDDQTSYRDNLKTRKYDLDSRGSLDEHIDNANSKQKKYKCHLCDQSRNRKHDLKVHIESVHLNMKQHRCDLCDFSANRKYYLKIHIDSVHLNLKPHKCTLCDFSTHLRRNLKVHNESVHLNLKEHKCILCDFATNHKYSLKVHIESVHLNLKLNKCNSFHSDVKSYECDLCDYASNNKQSLKGHIDYVHLNLKQHKCYFCDFSANRKDHLKIHIDSVHLNLKSQKCILCDFATNHKQSLKVHIESVHLNLKQHKCSVCDFSTNCRRNLRVHFDSIHLNLKLNKCNLCEFSSNHKQHLKAHINKVHSNVKQ